MRAAGLGRRLAWHQPIHAEMEPGRERDRHHVHRAMDEGVRLADIDAHGSGAAAQPHAFPAAALPADPARAAAVTADLAAVDAALAGGDDDTIRAAYRAMRADAWQLIAGQDTVTAAFILLNGVPFSASTTLFEDRFDGTADTHWFYRVSSRNVGGLTSGLSPSTPPICAPRTTPPRPPRALLALAGDASVSLRFAPSPSENIARYLVYRTMTYVVRVRHRHVRDMFRTGACHAGTVEHRGRREVQPTADGNALRWVDTTRHRVASGSTGSSPRTAGATAASPARCLTARSLYPPPDPAVWVPVTRTGTTVHLSWTHPDPRLASSSSAGSAAGRGRVWGSARCRAACTPWTTTRRADRLVRLPADSPRPRRRDRRSQPLPHRPGVPR